MSGTGHMIGKKYLVQQVLVLLRMSKAVHDPATSGRLAAKAAELASRLDDGQHQSERPIGPTESDLGHGKETG
jgi:hypothetical protein